MNRQDYLGASEVGAIMSGCDEYDRTPLTVYLQKLGLKDTPESEIMQRGNDLEPIVFAKYVELFGNSDRFEYQPTDFENPIWVAAMPWLGCHPDAMSEDNLTILEIKLVQNKLAIEGQDPQEWLKAFHPSKYWQCQTMMAITGARKVRIIFHTNNYTKEGWHLEPPIEITPNPDDISKLVEMTYTFWHENVLKKIPPEYDEPEKIELTTDYVETDPQIIQDIDDFAVMSKQVKDLDKALDGLKAKLKTLYSQKPFKSILAGQILLRANIKSGASRLSKDRCIAQGLDLTGCFERGAPVYTLEVVRRKDE